MIKFTHGCHVLELAVALLYATFPKLLCFLRQSPSGHLIWSDKLINHPNTVKMHFVLAALVKEERDCGGVTSLVCR